MLDQLLVLRGLPVPCGVTQQNEETKGKGEGRRESHTGGGTATFVVASGQGRYVCAVVLLLMF